MAEKKMTPQRGEAQSHRFLDLRNELEAAGDLSPTDGEGLFEALANKALPR